jgi:hypothetical protein
MKTDTNNKGLLVYINLYTLLKLQMLSLKTERNLHLYTAPMRRIELIEKISAIYRITDTN